VPPGDLQHVGLFARPREVVLDEHSLQTGASSLEVLDLALDLPEERLQHAPEPDAGPALPKDPFDALQREAEGSQLLYPVQPHEVLGRVEAIPGLGAFRSLDQPQLFVVPDGLRGNAKQCGDLPD
jgi:hypothetical protein